MIRKVPTSCCALCQLTCPDTTSREEIAALIETLKEEAKLVWAPDNRTAGERACYVITTQEEKNLKANLNALGFEVITDFSRRNGYPPGNLEMHILSW